MHENHGLNHYFTSKNILLRALDNQDFGHCRHSTTVPWICISTRTGCPPINSLRISDTRDLRFPDSHNMACQMPMRRVCPTVRTRLSTTMLWRTLAIVCQTSMVPKLQDRQLITDSGRWLTVGDRASWDSGSSIFGNSFFFFIFFLFFLLTHSFLCIASILFLRCCIRINRVLL